MSSSIRKRNVKTLHFGVLDKKQGELEDEIYHIFRKCRLITNIRYVKSWFILEFYFNFCWGDGQN